MAFNATTPQLKTSYNSFMPYWAGLLRDIYLERRQQYGGVPKAQAYYFEVHRKSKPKSKRPPEHNISNCPFAPKKQQSAPEPDESASAKPKSTIETKPLYILPTHGVVLSNTNVLVDNTVPVYLADHPKMSAQIAVPERTWNFDDVQDKPALANFDSEASIAESEYGFCYEAYDLPTRVENAPHDHRAPLQSPEYTFAARRSLIHTPSPHPAVPQSTTMHTHHHHQHHTQPDLKHRATEYRHDPYPRPHHRDCMCDQYERCRANYQRYRHGAVPHRHAPSFHESPALARHSPHFSARASFRTERRPSYIRNRTPTPRSREI